MGDAVQGVFVDLDGSEVLGTVCGIGGSGIVVREDDHVVKIPVIFRESKRNGVPVPRRRLTPEREGDYDERVPLRKTFDIEKSAYGRLGEHDGIVKCLNAWTQNLSIEMPFMEKGDLRHYLALNRPDKRRQLSWFVQVARTLAYIHSKRILVTDIRSDNLLLDDDLSIVFCDFGNATVMPLDWNLKGTDEDGYSVQTDIGTFSALMFQIIEDKYCKFDLFLGWKGPGDPLTLPARDSLPSTQGVWLGDIIERCWMQGFDSAQDTAAALDQVVTD